MQNHKKYVIWWLGIVIPILIFAFWLRIDGLDFYPTGLSNDEGKNVVDGFWFKETGVTTLYEYNVPEPLYRMILGVGMIFFGEGIWAARYTSVLLSMLSIVTTYWLAHQAFADIDRRNRRVLVAFALVSITVMVGHATLSRALYRGMPMLIAMTLSLGFFLQGLRRYRWRDFIWGGIYAGISIYTYTAALFFPIVLAILGASLFLTKFREIKCWLPRMTLAGVIALLIISYTVYLLVTFPEAILARSTDVASNAASPSQYPSLLIDALFLKGDGNSQYNVGRAPLIAPIFQPFFVVGLLVLLIRIRKASSVALLATLVIMAIPSLASDTPNHGLRIIGVFVAIPLVIAASWIPLIWIGKRLDEMPQRLIISVSMIVIMLLGIVEGNRFLSVHRDYFDNSDQRTPQRLFGLDVPPRDWFFLPDRMELARWIADQDRPILVPNDTIANTAFASWMLQSHPNVETANADFTLPEDTQLLMTWNVGLDSLSTHNRHFVLYTDDTLILLPPMTIASHETLIDGIEDAEELYVQDVDTVFDFLGTTGQLDNPQAINFDPVDYTLETMPLATFGDGQLLLTGLYGETTLTDASSFEYTLLWTPTRQLWHNYSSFLQLQTQDFEAIANSEHEILRWLYPPTGWNTADSVPDTHTLEIDASLPYGAYRLVAGLYYENRPYLQAESNIGSNTEIGTTIAWVKVPPVQIVTLPDPTNRPDVVINEQFSLEHIAIEDQNGQITVQLYWRSLIDRPLVDATIFVHAVDGNGEIVAQNDARPHDGQYPTFIWDENEIIVTEHPLIVAPEDLDRLQLRVGMYTFPGPQNLIATVGDTSVENGAILLETLASYQRDS